MKTPRNFILESHRAAETRLDRLSEAVLATELGTARKPSPGRPNPARAMVQKLWLELIWPSRRTWAGLAAVWVVLAVAYVTTRRPYDPTAHLASQQPMTSWVEEEQLLAQLLDRPPSAPAKAPAPARPASGDGPPAKSAQWLADECSQFC
jgi:hypothetical protein